MEYMEGEGARGRLGGCAVCITTEARSTLFDAASIAPTAKSPRHSSCLSFSLCINNLGSCLTLNSWPQRRSCRGAADIIMPSRTSVALSTAFVSHATPRRSHDVQTPTARRSSRVLSRPLILSFPSRAVRTVCRFLSSLHRLAFHEFTTTFGWAVFPETPQLCISLPTRLRSHVCSPLPLNPLLFQHHRHHHHHSRYR